MLLALAFESPPASILHELSRALLTVEQRLPASGSALPPHPAFSGGFCRYLDQLGMIAATELSHSLSYAHRAQDFQAHR